MARSELRVYLGPDRDGRTTTVATQQPPAPTVAVPLGEILPLLADAVQSQRTWLKDFEEDDVNISADLYEVLSAYRHLRPTA